MFVERICQHEVDVAKRGESVVRIAERMRQRTVGCLVVVNDDLEPIGVVTDRDLVTRVVAEGMDPHTTAVETVMTPHPQKVEEGTLVEDALQGMRSGCFRRLPIVDAQGKLIGIITLDDILMDLAEDFAQVRQLLHGETPRAAAAT